LFLYTPGHAGGDDSFQVWVRPDPEQLGARSEAAIRVSCVDLEGLEVCLQELGAAGWSRYLGEPPGAGGPVFEFMPCTVAEVIAFLRTQPRSPFGHLTLVAPNVPIAEMRRRLDRLRARGEGS